MKGWAAPTDLYAYWPMLANISEITDEHLRQHLEEAEEIVDTDLQSQGFRPPFTGDKVEKILRRLVVMKTLGTVLLYPFGEGGTPGRYTRAAQDFEMRYAAELVWATRTLGALGSTVKRTAWGPVTRAHKAP